jgi:signal transduction histidine kinase
MALTFEDRVNGHPVPCVLADRLRLKQVLTNLLSNAVKYNRPGGEVSARAWVDDAQLVIEVSDTGVGIDATQQARLFMPFDRLGAQRSKVPGAGLGLALSRQLLLAMGGQVAVRSQPGQGSTFSVRLPIAAGDP